MSTLAWAILATVVTGVCLGLICSALYRRFFGPQMRRAIASGDIPYSTGRGLAAVGSGMAISSAAFIITGEFAQDWAIASAFGLATWITIYLRTIFLFSKTRR